MSGFSKPLIDSTASALACLLLLVAVPLVASAQRLDGRDHAYFYGDDAGMVAYSIDVEPHGSRLVLTGRNRLSGPAPLRIPADIRGRYRVETFAPGYETLRAVLDLPGGGNPLALHGPHHALGAGRLTVALLWPGAAAIRDGDGLRGSGWLVGAAISASLAAFSHADLHQAIDDAGATRRELQVASGTEAFQRARVQLVRDDARVERMRGARRDWIVMTGIVWGVSVADYFLLGPGPGDPGVGLTDATLRLRPMSRARATLRSLIPGQGQLYARRPRAAALSVFGSLAAGVGLVLAEQAYDEAVDRVAGLARLYDDPQADPESLALLRPALEDEIQRADSRRSTRNVMLGMTAGIWALGLLDAYLGTPVAAVERPFGRRQAAARASTPALEPTVDLLPTLALEPTGGLRAGACLAF